MKESEIRKKLKESKEKILENSRKMNEEIDRIKLEEVKEVAKEIKDLFPDGISEQTFGRIMAIIAKYQKKKEEPFFKLLEMERTRRILELEDTRIDDPDWWTKASAAKFLGIEIPGMEESLRLSPRKRNSNKRK